MFSSELVSVCAIVGGACITTFIVLLHYFKDRVDDYVAKECIAFFSSEDNVKLIKDISEGEVSSNVSEALASQLSKTQEPRVKLKRLVLVLPIAGCLFIISAIIGSLAFSKNEFILQIATEIEIFADSLLAIAVIFLIYSIVQLVRLNRKLV